MSGFEESELLKDFIFWCSPDDLKSMSEENKDYIENTYDTIERYQKYKKELDAKNLERWKEKNNG